MLARTAHGPVASIDDLVGRNILPYEMVSDLRATLVAVPPMVDAPKDAATY
ncbi:hypothetical protein GCM10022254_54690 [Actinomadura meridiana]|uniref:Uncharacterized protein n=1 Tax=Actinomadura meridiana TaxID=559626 RepID=A0ABP8CF15_9ACTN